MKDFNNQSHIMKHRILLPVLAALAIAGCTRNLYGVLPSDDGDYKPLVKTAFTRGVNLASCFDVSKGNDASNIWMGYINDETFQHLVEMGMDVVRVPMTLGRFAGPASSDYKLQDAFWKNLDILLDLGDKYGITVIIDNHQGGYVAAYPDDHAEGFMKSVWRQIATHCKDRSSKVVYELQNEPDGDWWKDHWHELQGQLIEEIRKVDTSHSIIVTANPGRSMSELPEYEDDNLIYTFHFYSPMVFTHQGASWTDLKNIGGKVPYPWNDKFDGEALAGNVSNTTYKKNLLDYAYLGTELSVQQEMDNIITEARRRNVRLFMGEFGVIGQFETTKGAPAEDRCRWHEFVRKYAEQNGISWTVWKYSGDFGLFNVERNPKFNRDLNLDLIKALGFQIPPVYQGGDDDESGYTKMVLYDDAFGKGLKVLDPSKLTYLTIPCKDNPAVGENCIKWDITKNWADIYFSFLSGEEDLTRFNLHKTSIRFRFRAEMKNAKSMAWSIWFRNDKTKFKEPSEQQNWVAAYRITSANVKTDGEWCEVKIPLSDFDYIQSDGAPYESSKGHFSWAKVQLIRFTPENFSGPIGATFYVDDVMIVGPLDPDWTPENPDPGKDNPDSGKDKGGTIEDFKTLPEVEF